jgi:hypothetical protein
MGAKILEAVASDTPTEVEHLAEVILPPGIDPYYSALAPDWLDVDHALFGTGASALITTSTGTLDTNPSDAELVDLLGRYLEQVAAALFPDEDPAGVEYDRIPREAQRLAEDYRSLAQTHNLAKAAYEVALAARTKETDTSEHRTRPSRTPASTST